MNSASTQQKYPVAVFEFSSVTHLVTFLLTSQEDTVFRPGTVLFEKFLNRLYVDSKSKRYFIRVQADQRHLVRLQSIATGLSSLRKDSSLPKSSAAMSISDFMQRVSLIPAMGPLPAKNWLIGLWNAGDAELMEACAAMWDFGASQLDVGVAHIAHNQSAPSHFLRVFGVRDSSLIQGWMYGREKTTELYAPYSDRTTSDRFYVQDGYRYPTPGLTRLTNIQADLCLLRPQGWIQYRGGQIDFFTRPHVAAEITADLKSSEIQVFSRRDIEPIPLEIALEIHAHSGTKTLWQVDQEIDRQRRRLRELETARSKLVGRTQDEVYFAYRFNQQQDGQLNPLLVRMMRQNLAVLGNCDYAYCVPQQGSPYHLIIAGRTQKQLGFALQMADATYFAPSEWRRWGVNLFLPLDMQLSPAIDNREAIPLLQRFLERSSAEYPDEDNQDDYQMWDAILWDRNSEAGSSTNIVETRVKKLTPVLSEFRLLNSFQPEVARTVEEKTRLRLEQTLRETRDAVEDEISAVEEELLQYVAIRSEEVRLHFETLDDQIERANTLVVEMTPRVDQVAGGLLTQPEEWNQFVLNVMKAHQRVTQEPLAVMENLTDLRGKFSTQLLKTLIPQAHDLATYCDKQMSQLNRFVESLTQTQSTAEEKIEQTKELATRVNHVITEVQATHQQMKTRIQGLRAQQKQANHLQIEVETVDAKEKEIQARLAKVTEWHAAAEKKRTQLNQAESQLLKEERTIAERTLELAKLEQSTQQKLMLATQKLKQLGSSWSTYRKQSQELDLALNDLEDQVSILSAHEQAVGIWAEHYSEWVQTLEERHRNVQEHLDYVNLHPHHVQAVLKDSRDVQEE